MRTGSIRAGNTLVLAAMLAVGCGGFSPPAELPRPDPGDKTGARSGPITITVVDSQPQGKPSNLPLAEFARQVASLSGGSMTVEVVAEKLGDAIPAMSDGEVIDGVTRGAFEMAVVPARAWSDAGVTSLRALQAPLLIESDEHEAAVVSNDAISAELLGGLKGTGVTGLVLFPEGLRHLFGFGTPILSPADVVGEKIRTLRTRDTDAILEALGGLPIDAEEIDLEIAIPDGSIRGAESSFARVVEFPELPVATGNVVLYAKIDSLVVNDEFWTTLTEAQRTIVQDAADATRSWAIENQPTDADAAARYCATGGSVKLADPGSIDQFRTSLDDVAEGLAKDAAASELMTRIRQAKEGLSPEPVEACDAPIAMTIRPHGGDLPNGIYRVEYTDEYLKERGVTDIHWQHGVYTYRLQDGHWTLDQQADDVTADHDEGIYQVIGSDVFWRWDEEGPQAIEHLTWSVAPNGDLMFVATPESPDDWAHGLPFIRVGPVPD